MTGRSGGDGGTGESGEDAVEGLGEGAGLAFARVRADWDCAGLNLS